MRRRIYKLGLAGIALALLVVSGSTVLALPPQANAHAQAADDTPLNSSSADASPTAAGTANGQGRLTAARLRACQNREHAINTIMSRIDTRAQNQLSLFSAIATRVENFYTSKGKTVSNYNQLTAAIDSAKTQAQTDLGTMQTSSTLDCTGNNPKGVVSAFQSYLKTEITDLQGYRTAVKNLIVAVAHANGVTVSDSSTKGGQQ